MNEVLFASKRRSRLLNSTLRDLTWSCASHLGLHGLCPWPLPGHLLLVERRSMPLPGLGNGLKGATIAHISDLHLGPLMRRRHVERCVEQVNDLGPDFVVITGDFITVPTRLYARRVAQILAELQPRIASLACLGNHDHGIWTRGTNKGIPGLARYLAEQLNGAGVHVLINESHSFCQGDSMVRFVGLDDLWSPNHAPVVAMSRVPAGQPVIALCHNPDAAPRLAALGADYVLAGHTHGTPMARSALRSLVFAVGHGYFISGHYTLPGGAGLYVNRGLGPARRISAEHRPEITLFTLTDRADKARPDGDSA